MKAKSQPTNCVRFPSTIQIGPTWRYCQQPRLWSEFEPPSCFRWALIRARRNKVEVRK
jgi:hypothetical protein